MEFLNNLTEWEFMGEPLSRWFIWLGALTAMLYLWGVILSFMR